VAFTGAGNLHAPSPDTFNPSNRPDFKAGDDPTLQYFQPNAGHEKGRSYGRYQFAGTRRNRRRTRTCRKGFLFLQSCCASVSPGTWLKNEVRCSAANRLFLPLIPAARHRDEHRIAKALRGAEIIHAPGLPHKLAARVLPQYEEENRAEKESRWNFRGRKPAGGMEGPFQVLVETMLPARSASRGRS